MHALTALRTPACESDSRQSLRKIILAESVLKDGNFKLSSGRKSDIFFDIKKTLCHPDGANLVADVILDLIQNESADAIGGLEIGAVPVVIAVCVKSRNRRPIKSFFVRKERKQHGTLQLIDGHLKRGWHVILCDDVTTTGSSVLKAVEAVRNAGCTVSRVITIVDRLEGAADNLSANGLQLMTIFTRDDFL